MARTRAGGVVGRVRAGRRSLPERTCEPTWQPTSLPRLRAWQLVLPFWSSFTGLTVAMLRGWWVPPLPDRLPLFVASGRSDRIDRRRTRASAGTTSCRRGSSWTAFASPRPAEALLACARDLGLLDVVVLGDAALHAGDVTAAELRAVARQRRRGSPLLRRAIPLDGRPGRVDLRRAAADPPRRCAASPSSLSTSYAIRSGDAVARADLRIVGTHRLPEYDGADHLLPSPAASGPPSSRPDRRRRASSGVATPRRTSSSARSSILRDADRAFGRPHAPRAHRTPGTTCFATRSSPRPADIGFVRQAGLDAENAEQMPRLRAGSARSVPRFLAAAARRPLAEREPGDHVLRSSRPTATTRARPAAGRG